MALVCECGSTEFKDINISIAGKAFGDCIEVVRPFSECTKCGVIHPKEEDKNVGNKT